MYTECIDRFFWSQSGKLINSNDKPIYFDYDLHTFEFKEIGTITYRLLPKDLSEYNQVYIELSYADEELVTRGTVLKLNHHIENHLFEEHETTLWYFSPKTSTYYRRLYNYEWIDDYYLSSGEDDFYMPDCEFRNKKFFFEDIGDITYRLIPKDVDTNHVFVEISRNDDPTILSSSIDQLHEIIDNELF